MFYYAEYVIWNTVNCVSRDECMDLGRVWACFRYVIEYTLLDCAVSVSDIILKIILLFSQINGIKILNLLYYYINESYQEFSNFLNFWLINEACAVNCIFII